MSNRERLREAIQETVSDAINGGRTIDVNDLAIKLSSKYSQSGLTINVICAEIAGGLARINGEYYCHVS
jgi:hypothetical protein